MLALLTANTIGLLPVNAICRSARISPPEKPRVAPNHSPEWLSHFGQIGHDEARRPRKRRHIEELGGAHERRRVRVCDRDSYGAQSVCPLRVWPLSVCPLRVWPLSVCPLRVCPLRRVSLAERMSPHVRFPS